MRMNVPIFILWLQKALKKEFKIHLNNHNTIFKKWENTPPRPITLKEDIREGFEIWFYLLKTAILKLWLFYLIHINIYIL